MARLAACLVVGIPALWILAPPNPRRSKRKTESVGTDTAYAYTVLTVKGFIVFFDVLFSTFWCRAQALFVAAVECEKHGRRVLHALGDPL